MMLGLGLSLSALFRGESMLPGTRTLESFGAIGDGSTNDLSAWNAAVAALNAGTFRALLLGAKTYKVDGETTAITGDNVTIMGLGDASVLTTTSNYPLVFVNDADLFTAAYFRIEGNQTGSNQAGVYILNTNKARIHAVSVKSMFQGHVFEAGDDIMGPQYSDCKSSSCNYGFKGVYAGTLSNCQAYQCNRGLHVGNGNITWTGGEIIGCTEAVFLASGGNDGHGMLSGTSVNHNTNAIVSEAINNGFKFVGCNFYQGLTDFRNLERIVFVGCTLDLTTYVFDGSLIEFNGCSFDSDYFFSVTHNANSHPSETRFVECKAMGGTLPSWIGDVQQQSFSFAADANETLTRHVSAADTLTVADGSAAAARQITSARAPNKGNQILLRNGGAFNHTYKWSSGTTVTINAGTWSVVGADGTNAIKLASGTI